MALVLVEEKEEALEEMKEEALEEVEWEVLSLCFETPVDKMNYNQ